MSWAALLAWTVAACSSVEVAHQVAPVERAGLIDMVGDTPFEPLPVPAQEMVGALPGEALVQGGAASYTIDIEIPPGRRGMQPKVALRYDSRAGNGIIGVGWSLAAGSSIYRCARTIVHDGGTHGVDFSDEDRLCLDGQRLIAVRGVYGQAGSEYRTEINEFARIQLRGGSMASAIAYFQVESKAGTVAYYGGMGMRRTPRTFRRVRRRRWRGSCTA